MSREQRPYIVAIGGALHRGSTTEKALRHALALMNAHTDLFVGDDLDFPLFDARQPALSAPVERFVNAVRQADGVILASPGYHGGISGVLKNALDYLEFLREDDRPYFTGRAVGCIVNAAGWQGAMTTLSSLRDIVHALRGWPTPLGVCIAGADKPFDQHGNCISPAVASQLQILAEEVLTFALAQQRLLDRNTLHVRVA